MAPLAQWLGGQGIVLPSNAELLEAAIAFAIAVLALAAGWLAGDQFGAKLSAFWSRHVGGHAEGLSKRMRPISRHGTAALLLAIAAGAIEWRGLAALGLGVAEGGAVAMLTIAILRGLGLMRSAAWTMAAIAFVAILARALGGLAQLQARLDTGLTIGSHRVTLLSIISAAVTVVVIFALVRLASRTIAHLIQRSTGFDPTQKLLAQKLTGITIVIIAFFIGIDLLGIDLTAFAVFSGAFGLAIGFGLQRIVGNLLAGIILLMDRSIKPGDVIAVGNSFGWVNKIGARAVSIVTREGKEHLIPNEDLMTREVENWSYTDRNVRVPIPVKVAYSCDLKLAQELMLRATEESPRVLDTPKSNVWLTAFGDNGVEHEIRVWINDPEGGVASVKSDVLNRLWVLFKEHGIEIPFPQRVVRIEDGPRK